jgi:hypothetical protein
LFKLTNIIPDDNFIYLFFSNFFIIFIPIEVNSHSTFSSFACKQTEHVFYCLYISGDSFHKSGKWLKKKYKHVANFCILTPTWFVFNNQLPIWKKIHITNINNIFYPPPSPQVQRISNHKLSPLLIFK